MSISSDIVVVHQSLAVGEAEENGLVLSILENALELRLS